MKNVLTFLKLNKNKKVMRKAGWVDDNGNLTDDGLEVLCNILLDEHEQSMADLATDYLKELRSESKKTD